SFDSLLQRQGDRVVVDVTVTGNMENAKQQLLKAGAVITGSFGRVVSASVPVTSLDKLEQATQLRFVRPAYRPHHQGSIPRKQLPRRAARIEALEDGRFQAAGSSNLKTVYSQGDTAQASDAARKRSRVNGNGVKVGIISDSYNVDGAAAAGVKRGELPGPGNPFRFNKPVEVLSDMESGGIDEGRAMAEIVHDVAPGAALAFATAMNGQGAFAENILKLADRGCKVITDDIFYYAEPFFQDGIIAQAVDKVNAKGVTYFSAAGNTGNNSYEHTFRESREMLFGEGRGTAHNFAGAGKTPVYLQQLYVPQGGFAIIDFQWAQPAFSAGGSGSETDLDLYVIDADGNIVVAALDDNITSGDPFEITGFTNFTESTTFYLAILKYSGVAPPRVKYIMFGAGLIVGDNLLTPGLFAPTIVGHANAAGAIATGATWYRSTPAFGLRIPVAQPYSSIGGVAIYFDKTGNAVSPAKRNKPEISAPDGANTSFFQYDDFSDDDEHPNFSGTSAAAPHAAGTSALMIEAQKLKTISPDQIRGILCSNTYDMDHLYTPGFDKGFDNHTGYGLIRADKAVAAVKFPNAYIKDLQLVSVCSENPASVRNWKITNPNPFEVKIHWFVAGTAQQSTTIAAPGTTYFTTRPLYYRNKPLPNIVVLDWEDNFGFTRFDITSATSSRCNQVLATTETFSNTNTAVMPDETIAGEAYAEVFPNPSVDRFRLYLALPDGGKAEIRLFSQEGKLLMRNNVAGKGVHDIDASRYPTGIYILEIGQGAFTKTLRLIKQ
ncbi:MAG: T9SS type A sorting domain-containing protein, partial [Sphingobacteriales bacterium]